MLKTTRFCLMALAAMAWSCALATPSAAQCPAKTTVTDTLYNADGSLASGRITIAWPTFLIGSCQVIAGQTTVTVTNGAFSSQLYPNTSAVPSGTSYRITFALRSGRITTEYWVVPTSAAPVALVSVRAPTVPIPAVMFAEAQVTNLVTDLLQKIELPSPCPSGKVLESNGSSTPPQVSCVDPSGGGSGSQHQVNSANLASNNPVNFQDSASISFSNPSAGIVQASVRDGAITAAKLNASSPSTTQLSGLGNNNIAASAISADRVIGTAVVQTRTINAASPLTGGGDLSADRTLGCPTCEITANKGAVSGYASLNASSKVVQDPANAQTAPAASKIPVADGAGKLADGWLSSSVSLLGNTVDLASEVSGLLPTANGGTGANNAATTGRYLRGNGTTFSTSSGAAAGVGACTNQVITSANDDAAPTCNTITSAYVDSSVEKTSNRNAAGGYAGLDGNSRIAKAQGNSATVYNDQSNTYTGATTQDMSVITAVKLPSAAGAAPTAGGDIRFDTTRAATVGGGNQSTIGFYPRVLKMTNCTSEGNCTSASGGNQVDAASGAQGTTETNFASNWSMPANFLFTNKAIQVCGVFQLTTSTSAPSLTVRFKLGSTNLVAHPATAPGNNLSSRGSSICFILQGTAAAASSVSVEAGYFATVHVVSSSTTFTNNIAQPVSGINTSSSQTIQISAQWGTATSGNTVRLQQFYVMELN